MPREIPWTDVDACTLPSSERPLRVAEFDEVFARHLTGATRPRSTEAQLQFSGGRPVEAALRDLTRRESQCCSFFTFDVDRDAETVTVAVQVPAAQQTVLQALVNRARLQAAPERRP